MKDTKGYVIYNENENVYIVKDGCYPCSSVDDATVFKTNDDAFRFMVEEDLTNDKIIKVEDLYVIKILDSYQHGFFEEAGYFTIEESGDFLLISRTSNPLDALKFATKELAEYHSTVNLEVHPNEILQLKNIEVL